MKTVKQVIKELQKYPPDATCYAYEGEVTGLNIGEDIGFIDCHTSAVYPQKIKHNKIQCKECGDVIESVHRHDFRSCKCEKVCVDGGQEYLRRCGDRENIIELSEFDDDDDNDDNDDTIAVKGYN